MEGIPKHVVNGIGNTVNRNVDHWRRQTLADVANLLCLRSVSDGQDEFLHGVHLWVWRGHDQIFYEVRICRIESAKDDQDDRSKSFDFDLGIYPVLMEFFSFVFS